MGSDAHFEEGAELVAQVLGLEAARILAIASLGRARIVDDEGAPVGPEQVQQIDQALEVVLEGLARRGIAYPGHMLGGKYDLGGPEYLILQLALMPHHSPSDFASLMRVLGSDELVPRLSHALTLLAPPGRHADLAERLEGAPLFAEDLVKRSADPDPALVPHLAVLELYGLDGDAGGDEPPDEEN